jgi:DNA-binding IclR family transcriptional regulator
MVERVFAVLSAFDDDHRSLRLTTLADHAGLPINTTLRIARSLVEVGALEHTDRGEYVVGLRLFEIAALAPRAHGLRHVAMPYLGDLSAAVGQHVLLTVRDGDKAVLVERLSAHGAPTVSYRVGGRVPLDSTGAGLVLLAHAPAEMQVAHERRGVVRGAHPLFDRRELRHRLADIRATNTVLVKPRAAVRMATAAAAIRESDHVVAAVSVLASPEHADIDAILPAVVTVARSISRAVVDS